MTVTETVPVLHAEATSFRQLQAGIVMKRKERRLVLLVPMWMLS